MRELLGRSVALLWPAALLFSAACGAVPEQLLRGPQVELPPPPPVVKLDRPALPGLASSTVVGRGGLMRLHIVERHDSPVVEVRWVLPGGRQVEEGGRRLPEGTLDLLCGLLTEGTQSHPEGEWATALANHGAQLAIVPAGDAVVLELRVLSHQLAPALGLMREALLEPSLDAAALDALKLRYAADARNQQLDVEEVAGRIARRVEYGAGSAYGTSGVNPASLARIGRKQLQEAWSAAFALGESDLVAVGDVAPEPFARQVGELFGHALRTQSPPPATTTNAMPGACHVAHVAGASQTAVVWTGPGPTRGDPQWPLLMVANQIVGGSGSSRLFQALRERHGLTYGVFSQVEGARTAGRWVVGADVATDKTIPALDAFAQELQRLHDEPALDDEVTAARHYLQGQFLLSLVEPGAVADAFAARRAYRLPDDAPMRWYDAVATANPYAVQAVMHKWLPRQPHRTVLVGNLDALRPALDERCARLNLYDGGGNFVRVLVGSDADMGDVGRAAAFQLWAQRREGLGALKRYVSDTSHDGEFRAQAVAAATRQGAPVLQLARQTSDWRNWRASAVSRWMRLLSGDGVDAIGARALLLELASTPGELDVATADQVRGAVARWALAETGSRASRDDLRAQALKRLEPGDLRRLGKVSLAPYVDALADWVAADGHRLEAAEVLTWMRTPDSDKALLRSYSEWFDRGGLPEERDLSAVASVPGPDGLLRLLQLHERLQASGQPVQLAVAERLMQTVKSQLPEHLRTGSIDAYVSALASVLVRRNPDDRWWAAGWLTRGLGMTGLRMVMDNLPSDDRWRATTAGTPESSLAAFAREAASTLGRAQLQPYLLAALVRASPVAKVVAVKMLHALGDEASFAALRTLGEERDISSLLGYAPPWSVRDVALAACDAHALSVEFDAAVAAGQMTTVEASVYREAAFSIMGLQGPRLRAEVLRQGRARMPAAKTATPPPPAAPKPAGQPAP
jgi:predicted Zn-dependent peptidase/transposase-like protein